MDILVIEDEIEIAHFIKKGLEAEHFFVEAASDGESGIKLALKGKFDLIILDVVLPGKNGFQVCQYLREQNLRTPILMLTCKDAAQDRIQGFRVGANDYLIKPFAFEELLARLRELTKRGLGEKLPERLKKVEDFEETLVSTQNGSSKILMYSHDTFGLGHLKRTLKIASYLVDNYANLSILILSGSPVVHALSMPKNLDYIKLPSVRKVSAEEYKPRQLTIEFAQVREVRKKIIDSTSSIFQPDIFLVDHSPLGMQGEILSTLKYLKENSPQTKLVLGLRDILDEPETVVSSWKKQGVYDALEFLYDYILVYGSQNIFDIMQAYQIPDHLQPKFRYCGYVTPHSNTEINSNLKSELGFKKEKMVLLTIGGGDDGFEIIKLFLEALKLNSKRIFFDTLIITGPFLTSEQKTELEQLQLPALVQTKEFFEDLSPYLKAADLVVSMGGYNTFTEILRYSSQALIIPRITPRQEQFLRAQIFSQMGMVSMLSPEDLTPLKLGETVERLLNQNEKPLLAARQKNLVDLNGCQKVGEFLAKILNFNSKNKVESNSG